MTKEKVVRAWKDPLFRASLPEEERLGLPESPAGASLVELDEAELPMVNGGRYHQTSYEPSMFVCWTRSC